MKTHRNFLRLRTSVLAVNGALALMGMAYADSDPTVAELTQPTNKIELGAGYTDQNSAKANEYTGLRGRGAYLIGNFDLAGGGSYDSDTTRRWRLLGRDLGQQNGSLKGEYSKQGSFRLRVEYDELLRNGSDSFQTPYLGVGSSKLSLPSNWVTPLVPQNSATGANARGLSPAVTAADALVAGAIKAGSATPTAAQTADLPAFRIVPLSTKRQRIGAGGELHVTDGWSVSMSGSHEEKSGLKAFSAISRLTGGDISATLPHKVDQDHDQYRVAANYAGASSTLQLAYDASLFTNYVNSVTWSMWTDPTKLQSMGTAPSNQFHKLSLAGTYDLAPAAKLIGNVSYGRATQDQVFLNDAPTQATAPLVPQTSLHGLVVTENVTLKLATRPSSQSHVNVGFKHDVRDNRTPVSTYGYYDTGELKNTGTSPFSAYLPTLAGGYGSNLNINANRPYSKRVNQLNLDGDYRFSAKALVNGGLESQHTSKYCTGSWIDCSDAAKSHENTARVGLNLTPTEDFSARIGASHSRRKVEYNEDAFLALVPMANRSPSTATGALAGTTAYQTMLKYGLTGYGPVAGFPATPLPADLAFYFPNNNALSNGLYGNANRISELVGMRRYNNANRNRSALRTSANWQATETFTLQGGVDVNRDNYSESVYGLQKATSWALNLDGTYTASENFSVSVFYSHEDQRSTSAGNTYTANNTVTGAALTRTVSGGCFDGQTNLVRLNNSKLDPCLNWQSKTTDKVNTLGLTLNRTNLLSKLDLSGSLIYSRLKSDQDVSGGNYANNPYAGVAGNPTASIAAYYIPATALPTVKTDSIELRLGGVYRFNKEQAVRVGYSYQHMKAVDWAYDGLQYGSMSGVLPTSEQAPTYSVHNFGVAYIVTFR